MRLASAAVGIVLVVLGVRQITGAGDDDPPAGLGRCTQARSQVVSAITVDNLGRVPASTQSQLRVLVSDLDVTLGFELVLRPGSTAGSATRVTGTVNGTDLGFEFLVDATNRRPSAGDGALDCR